MTRLTGTSALQGGEDVRLLMRSGDRPVSLAVFLTASSIGLPPLPRPLMSPSRAVKCCASRIP
jgi:hypothetical protein